MSHFELLPQISLFFLSFILLIITINYVKSFDRKFPKSYPFIGSSLAIFTNRHRLQQWLAEVLCNSPTGSFVLHRPLGVRHIITVNPANVKHMLKTHFYQYPKGRSTSSLLDDFLGSGIFNVDGNEWKSQRQICSHVFSTKSLSQFVETVVETELSDRLIPILSGAATKNSVLDLQDILQRFTFDNICKIAFGFDPSVLLESLPQTDFAVAFEDATMISGNRFISPHPIIWKVKRAFDIGSEKRLRKSISEVRQFAQSIVRKKKELTNENSSVQTPDLLSRILKSGHSDEEFVTDMVISFVIAGRDTTSAALTWFFWLVSNNAKVEEELLKEIREKSDSPIYEKVRDMVYTHASLCESMRLYPPVPADTKEAACDDILPDGTVVKKGMRVTYHPYAMGRMENLWGSDCLEFKPERWLEKDKVTEKWILMPKDAFTYPVFQAGPRVCLGKDMAFLQMKRIVAGVLPRYRIVPLIEKGREPHYTSFLTSKMKGGFPVRIEQREVGDVI